MSPTTKNDLRMILLDTAIVAVFLLAQACMPPPPPFPEDARMKDLDAKWAHLRDERREEAQVRRIAMAVAEAVAARQQCVCPATPAERGAP